MVSGIAQDFRGANNYRPNVTCDPMASGSERTIANWFNKALRRACRPTPVSRSATRSATPCAARIFWQIDLAAVKRVALGGPAQFEFRARGVQPAEPHELPCPRTATAAPAAFGTITSTYDPRQLQLGFKFLW